MGLLKPEFQGGAQAVRADVSGGLANYGAGSPSQEHGAYGSATGYTAFSQQVGVKSSYYDAAVSNDLEDFEVDEIVARQEEQVLLATERLNQLESQHKEIEVKGRKGSSPDASTNYPNLGADDEPLVKRIGKALSNLPPVVTTESPVKMPFEKILLLLLASLKGSYAKRIPSQKCGSPVPYNSATTGYYPMFYVSKERKTGKHDEGFEGIPVRYQGFTKSTVWFSEDYPRWGIVARRMQHQSRMKLKSACDQNVAASKAALFFHVFEGFSYVLIERTNADVEIDKSNLASFVVENAAKFVQIWPIQRRSGLSGYSRGGRTPTSPTLSSVTSSSSPSAALDSHLMRVKLENFSNNENSLPSYGITNKSNRQRAISEYDHMYGPSPNHPHHQQRNNERRPPLLKKRSFDSTTSSIPENESQREIKRRSSFEDDEILRLSFNEHGAPLQNDFDFHSTAAADDGSVHSSDMLSSPNSDYSSGVSMATSIVSNHNQRRSSSKTNIFSYSMPNLYDMDNNMRMQRENGKVSAPENEHASPNAASTRVNHSFVSCGRNSRISNQQQHEGRQVVDILGDGNLFLQDDEYSSGESDETTLHDIFLEESDDGLGGSLDPFGVVLCDTIFKTFCDSMEGSQFAREYERVQSLLFNKQFALILRTAVDNKDPRLTQDFLFPDFPSAKFLDNQYTATLQLVEREVGTNDFYVRNCGPKCREILKMDPQGMPNVFESLDKSDMSYIMARYYWLKNKSSSYWFQRILSLKDGHNVVIRGYATTTGCSITGKQAVTVRFQDVSSAYQELLSLPSFDILL